MRYLLGYDVGSSSVKASLVEAESGQCVASDFYPKQEAPIKALRAGWAEQNPEDWWKYLVQATRSVLSMAKKQEGFSPEEVAAIGLSWQMHGLVCLDKGLRPLRDAIIWCDSRAVPFGQKAFDGLGKDYCMGHLLNSPGNFTAAKLAWVKENEPEIFEKIDKIMLPGDYIALKLSGECSTTIEGLSEGMLWDFAEKRVATELLDFYGFGHSLIPPIVPNFGLQQRVSKAAAEELGLSMGTPITYRAGDQPNNALSLNVLQPGEIAATAGTSGVVYGVSGEVRYDPLGRVNTFAHVNYTPAQTRLGVLLCINGTGILNSWLRHNVVPKEMTYDEMNRVASQAPIGCDGLSILPFGNGSERMLDSNDIGCSIHGLAFNRHGLPHLLRAAQEGIAFSFRYGVDIMRNLGIDVTTIRAGKSNMFLSPLFAETLSTVCHADIELMNTDGAAGAARGAGLGANIYSCAPEAFRPLKILSVVHPEPKHQTELMDAYGKWLEHLK